MSLASVGSFDDVDSNQRLALMEANSGTAITAQTRRMIWAIGCIHNEISNEKKYSASSFEMAV
jgi:hypothetical protein